MPRIALLATCLVVTACGESTPATTSATRPTASRTPPPPPAAGELDQRFVGAIRTAAAGYLAWGRVDERPNIAPGLCRMPMPRDYGSDGDVHLTQADDGSPHGKKLYYLYASERGRYLAAGTDDAALPIGLTVVKQSFAPKVVSKREIDAMAASPAPGPTTSIVLDRPAAGVRWVATADGTYLVPDEPRGLFVMTKVAQTAADGTDEGWIYGTVTPEGEVTSAGRVATCMHCHVEMATHERLFGLK